MTKQQKAKQKKLLAYTLTEILIAVAIIGIIVAIAIPMLGTAKTSAKNTQIDANLTRFNTIGSQMRSAGYTNAGNSGNDKAAALKFYQDKGILRRDNSPDLTGIDFENGVWKRSP